MTNKKLNRLLSILDEYEISLDVTEDELNLLPDELVDVLEHIYNKSDIIAVLIINIRDLRKKMENEHRNTEIIDEPSEKAMSFRTKEQAIKIYATDQRTKENFEKALFNGGYKYGLRKLEGEQRVVLGKLKKFPK